VLNLTWQNTTSVAPASFHVYGPSRVYLHFVLQYWVAASSTAGGSTGGGNLWANANSQLTINATPSAGYFFVDWSGSGLGSVSSTHSTIVLYALGPITEVATFAPNPLPTWTVTIQASSLPVGTAYSVEIGNDTYAGSGTISATGLATGSYAVSVPYAYLNASTLTRFVPTSVTSSYVTNEDGTIEVDGNGTVTVDFATEVALTLSASAGGTASFTVSGATVGATSGAAGSAWVELSSEVALTATPSAGHVFLGWSGSGAGALNSSASSASFEVMGPVSEVATFGVAPAPAPLTYVLTLEPEGLPASAGWNVTVGASTGVSATGPIAVAGLNGSYTITVPVVVTGPGTRFVNSTGTFNVDVTGNLTVVVGFSAEYLVSVTGSVGGTVGPAGGWVAPGTTVTLSATPQSGYVFVNWSGTGTGAYSGNATGPTITVNGPVSEVARFVQPAAPAPSTGSSSTTGLPIAIGLFVVLLAVGLVAGVLLGRGRERSGGGHAVEAPVEPSATEGASDEGTGGPG